MIEIDISKRFGALPADDSRSAPPVIEAKFSSDAKVLALFGRSGSGKSTVVNAIAGLVKPDRGRVTVAGETLFDSERGINMPIEQRGVGYVFQEGLLFPHLTVRQNLLYGAARGAGDHGRGIAFDSVVQLLGIDGLLDRAAPTLSGGEKQRVAIGRALLSKPRLLLMDEPLASLDTGRRSEILRLIERVRDEFGVNIVYVSHSIGEVSRLADDVVLMNDGRVVACAATEEIFNRADLRPYTGRFEGGALIEAHAERHDMRYFLTTFKFDGGELVAPGVDTPIGARVRIRIRARDVTLATQRPQGISVRNILEGRVGDIEDRGGAIVEVHVQLPGRDLLSRISRQAFDEMKLEAGQPVFALIKAIAFDKRSMGFTA
jgi:molybdate transport system ATP-binding protein